jgi:probable HAF family extracellular repeat protein/autotransporter-associated beta strand protein
MHLRQSSAVVCIGSALLTLVPSAPSGGAAFQGLGHLQGGTSFSQARAVSGDGTTIVGVSGSPKGEREAFRWTMAGGMTGLGALPGATFYSDASAVSREGAVVVGYSLSTPGEQAFRWTASDGMTGLGDLPGGVFASRATGVSADGAVVVGTGSYAAGGGPLPVTGEAFRWTSSTGMVGLGDVRGGSGVSRAFAVSADGSVIVGKGDAAASFQVENLGVATRWTAADGMQSLGFLPGGSGLSVANAVSPDGLVVAGYSLTATGKDAFRWTRAGGMLSLGTLPGPGGPFQGYANGISADGRVIVGKVTSASGDAAFLWNEAGGMRRLQDVLVNDFGLNLAGWTLSEATGISNDGTVIVGFGNDPSGTMEAWRAEIAWPSNVVWSGAVNGTWDVNATANFSGSPSGRFNDGDHVTFSDSGSHTTIVIAAGGVAPGSIIFTNTAATDYSLSGGPMKGSTGLVVSAGGNVALGSANTYTGGTTVKAGTLTIDSADALPAGGRLTIGASGAVLLHGGGGTAASAVAVPEPATLALLGAAALGLLGWALRRP